MKQNKILPPIKKNILGYNINKVKDYTCQICKYIVISHKNKCSHQLCDYCLNTVACSKTHDCILCEFNFN